LKIAKQKFKVVVAAVINKNIRIYV